MGLERKLNRIWVSPPIGLALATVGLEEIGVCIAHHHNMVTQYISTRPTMDLCMEAERRPRMRLPWIWWGQPAIYILGIRAEHAAAKMGEETDTEDYEGER